MFNRCTRLVMIVGLFLVVGGCHHNTAAPQDPLLGQPLDKNFMDQYYHPMVESACASEMSVFDAHFHPHTIRLNSLGVRQLERLCPVLEEFGGTVGYATFSKDQDQINARLECIKNYLADAGLEMKQVHVEARISGGRGMAAFDALGAIEKSAAAGGGGYGSSSASQSLLGEGRGASGLGP